jgi:hypothetical protein
VVASGDDPCPPSFLYEEVVRIVGTTGSEIRDDGAPINAAALVGENLVVWGARPSRGQDGWEISLSGEPTDGWRVWFSESSLASSGLKQVWDEEDGIAWLPFDRESEPGWRDEVELFLVPDLTEREAGRARLLDWISEHPDRATEAKEIGWRAEAILSELVETEQEIELAFTEGIDQEDDEDEEGMDDHPFGFHLWLHPVGDAFAAFERIVGTTALGWEHDVEEGAFFASSWPPISRWRRPPEGEAVFITPGIREAEIICRYWTSPNCPTLPRC